MSVETQPLSVETKQPVNSTASEISPLHATGSAGSEKTVRATRRQTSKPRNKKSSLRPVAGTYWRSDGDGWELRKSGGANDPDKDKYLGRLSGKAYAKMKAEFQGEALAQALCEWAVSKAAEKGIEL